MTEPANSRVKSLNRYITYKPNSSLILNGCCQCQNEFTRLCGFGIFIQIYAKGLAFYSTNNSLHSSLTIRPSFRVQIQLSILHQWSQAQGWLKLFHHSRECVFSFQTLYVLFSLASYLKTTKVESNDYQVQMRVSFCCFCELCVVNQLASKRLVIITDEIKVVWGSELALPEIAYFSAQLSTRIAAKCVAIYWQHIMSWLKAEHPMLFLPPLPYNYHHLLLKKWSKRKRKAEIILWVAHHTERVGC